MQIKDNNREWTRIIKEFLPIDKSSTEGGLGKAFNKSLGVTVSLSPKFDFDSRPFAV